MFTIYRCSELHDDDYKLHSMTFSWPARIKPIVQHSKNRLNNKRDLANNELKERIKLFENHVSSWYVCVCVCMCVCVGVCVVGWVYVDVFVYFLCFIIICVSLRFVSVSFQHICGYTCQHFIFHLGARLKRS